MIDHSIIEHNLLVILDKSLQVNDFIKSNKLTDIFTELIKLLFAEDALNTIEKNWQQAESKSERPFTTMLDQFYSLRFQAISHGHLRFSEITDITLLDWYYHIKELQITSREEHYRYNDDRLMDYRTDKEIENDRSKADSFAERFLAQNSKPK